MAGNGAEMDRLQRNRSAVGRPRKRGKQSKESQAQATLAAQGNTHLRYGVLNAHRNMDAKRKRQQRNKQDKEKQRPGHSSDDVGHHTLNKEEQVTTEVHAVVSGRLSAELLHEFKLNADKRRRTSVPLWVKKAENEMASIEMEFQSLQKNFKNARSSLKALQRANPGVNGARTPTTKELAVSAGKLRLYLGQRKGLRNAKRQERRWKVKRRLWDLQRLVKKLRNKLEAVFVRLRGARTRLWIAMNSEEVRLAKLKLRQRRFVELHQGRMRARWVEKDRRRRSLLRKQRMILSRRLCAKVLENRQTAMPRTRRYLLERKKFVEDLAKARSLRHLWSLSGRPGMQQTGTRVDRIRRQHAFKETLVEQMFQRSRKTVRLNGPGQQDLLGKEQAMTDAALKTAIRLAVDQMLGEKKRALLTFLKHYRILRRTVNEWLDKKLTRELAENAKISWEEIIRPPEDAKHRQGQVPMGERHATWSSVVKKPEEPMEAGMENDQATDGQGPGQPANNDGQGTAQPGNMVKKKKMKETLIPCNDKCQLPWNWGQRLVDFLRQLQSPGDITGMAGCFRDLMEFENCIGCKFFIYERAEVNPKHHGARTGQRKLCRFGDDGCRDGIKLLLRLRYHSRCLDRLLDTVYKARRSMKDVVALESELLFGDYNSFHRMVMDLDRSNQQKDAGLRKSMAASGPALDSATIQRQFGHLFEAFRAQENDHPLNVCYWCDQFKRPSKIMHFENLDGLPSRGNSKSRHEMENMLKIRLGKFDLSEEDLAQVFPMDVCRQCWNCVRKGQVGPAMLENGLRLDDIPQELAVLNRYEEILVSRVRPFYSVVRLRPYGKGPADHLLLQATKGNAVHLRIPIAETIKHCLVTMPTPNPGDTLRLYADVKTQAGKVWRNLVNMDRVLRALEWLKMNNPLYKDIVIDREAAAKVDPDSIVALVEPSGGDDAMEQPQEEMGEHILTLEKNHELVSEFSMVPANNPQVKASQDLEVYMQTAIKGPPQDIKERCMDALTFPLLFPTGAGSFGMERNRNIRFAEHARYMLLRRDRRFRDCQTWMHQVNYVKLSKAVDQGVYASTKTGAGLTKLTAPQLIKRIEDKDMDVQNSVNSMFQNIKGTKEYWNIQKGDLGVMDEELGPATWFVTLSCAEHHWEAFESYIRERNADLPGIKKMSLQEVIQKDPAALSEFFHRRFKAFMDEVILKPDGPLGKIIHFYWRLEYQARGAPHIHMKLWQEGAPVLGQPGVTEEMVLAHISKYITALAPLDEVNPDLRQLVDTYQRHKCTNSCSKLKHRKRDKDGRDKFWRQCRYGFPRPVSMDYTMMPLEQNIKDNAKAKHRRMGRVKQWYAVPRGDGEVNINPYNPAILQCWRANMDIQFVGESTGILNSYITAYISKGEKGEAAAVFDAMGQDGSVQSRLMKVAYGAMKDREVGPYEMADDILGHHLHGSSDAVDWLGVGMPDKRTRKMLSYKDLKQAAETGTSVVARNLVENYYPLRHDKLSDLSLYDLHSWWKHKNGQPPQQKKKKWQEESSGDDMDGEDDLDLRRLPDQDGKGYFQARRKRILPKAPYIPCTRIRAEEYFYQLIQLHVPYRQEAELIRDCETYAEAFEQWMEEIPQLKAAAERKEQLRAGMELHEKLQAEALAEAQEEAAAENDNWNDADLGEASAFDPQGFRSADGYGTAEGLASRSAQLNTLQRQVYDQVLGIIRHQMLHDKDACSCGEKPSPVCKFVSGGAGVGKSRLIQTLTEAVEMETGERVRLSAPTGLAAQNIDGETCHVLFNLPIQQSGGAWIRRDLSKEQTKAMYKRLGKCKLLIIDEISMVSNLMLEFIHQRLVDMEGCDPTLAFGGFNIVVFGDLLQLPPVSEGSEAPPYCFTLLNKKQIKVAFPDSISLSEALAEVRRHQAGAVPQLWGQMDYAELTENMRQQGDRDFADMLNKLRVGNLEDCMEQLEPRIYDIGFSPKLIAELLKKLQMDGKRPVCLLPLVDQVLRLNAAMLVEDKVKVMYLHAVDQSRKRRIKKLERQQIEPTGDPVEDILAYLTANTTSSERKTGGLRDVMAIGTGARVMLTKNLDLAAGLFNGAMGTVSYMKLSAQAPDSVAAIGVRFDGDPTKDVEILRTSVIYNPSPAIDIVREQFPLTPSYAITVHKSQGLTLDCVVTDLGDTVFCPGMAYVALSRARTLEGLHLLRFVKSSVWADAAAVMEYNRLRRVGKTGLPDLILGRRAKAPDAPKVVKRRMDMAVPDLFAPPAKQPKRMAEKKKPAKKKTPKKKTTGNNMMDKDKMDTERRDGVYSGRLFIPLNNRRNECFSNAAVQALLPLRGVREWIFTGNNAQSDIGHALEPLVTAQVVGDTTEQTTEAVRQVVERHARQLGFLDNFMDDRQHDSLEYLKYLLRCNGDLRRKFVFRSWEVAKCMECAGAQEVNLAAPVDNEELTLDRPALAKESKTWTEVVRATFGAEQMYKRCQFCQGGQDVGDGTLHEKRLFIDIPAECQHLIIRLRRFGNKIGADGQIVVDGQGRLVMEERKGGITGFSSSNLQLGGVEWKTEAVVVHQGASINAGHYITWVNHQTDGMRWLIKSDKDCHTAGRFINSMKGVYYIILSRQD